MDIKEIERRFAFWPAKTAEKQAGHAGVRGACWDLAEYINQNVPEGREKSLAITNLEVVMFWANAALARPDNAAALVLVS